MWQASSCVHNGFPSSAAPKGHLFLMHLKSFKFKLKSTPRADVNANSCSEVTIRWTAHFTHTQAGSLLRGHSLLLTSPLTEESHPFIQVTLDILRQAVRIHIGSHEPWSLAHFVKCPRIYTCLDQVIRNCQVPYIENCIIHPALVYLERATIHHVKLSSKKQK